MQNNQPPPSLLMPGVKAADLPEVKCPQCQGKYFIPVTALREFTKLQSGNGQPGMLILQGYMCIYCDHVLGEEQKVN